MFKICIDDNGYYSTKNTLNLVEVEEMPRRLSHADELLAYKYNSETKLLELDETKLLELNLDSKKLESKKEEKIKECNSICHKMITQGVDINIDGNIEHFSYNSEDQMNIKELFDLSFQTNVPMFYHADGQYCKEYTTEQIIEIYTTASANKNHHTTYFNQLKKYINSLQTIEEVDSVMYGQELVGQYLDTYNASIKQAQQVLESVLSARILS